MSRVRSQRRASIDVGTNSVRLLVADVHPDGRVCALVQRGTVTRLGEGLDSTGRISPAAARRTLKAIVEAASEARATGAGPIVLAATSALRSAANGAEVAAEIQNSTGLELRILSGEEEARLVFSAVQGGIDNQDKVIVMDIGGGSTEFACGYGVSLSRAVSMQIGCVRLYERAADLGGIDTRSGYELARQISRAEFQGHARAFCDEFSGSMIRGVGGTFTAFAMVHRGTPRYDPGTLEGVTLEASEARRISETIRGMSLEERRRWVGEGRADLVPAGAAILDEAIEFFQVPRVQVSTHGLRYGLLHLVGGPEQSP